MKKKTKQYLTMALAITMSVSLLQGCKNNDTPKQTNPSEVQTEVSNKETQSSREEADTKLSGDVTFWHSFSQGPRLETIQKAADAFTEANPDVHMTIETFSWADFYTKWTTGLASKNVPDLSTALPNHVVEMIDVEAIKPLDDLIDRIGRGRFAKAPLEEMTVDGKCYAVPLYSHAQVMWYRKDLLEKYNLEVPTT